MQGAPGEASCVPGAPTACKKSRPSLFRQGIRDGSPWQLLAIKSSKQLTCKSNKALPRPEGRQFCVTTPTSTALKVQDDGPRAGHSVFCADF